MSPLAVHHFTGSLIDLQQTALAGPSCHRCVVIAAWVKVCVWGVEEEQEGYGGVGMPMTIPVGVSEELQHQLEVLFIWICVERCAGICFWVGWGGRGHGLTLTLLEDIYEGLWL